MSGINKVILLGRLGKDPEMRHTADGKAVANFSIATSKGKGDSEKTEWHRCTAWEKTAEVIEKYVGKGGRLYCEGELQTRKWTDKDGNERYTTEITVHKVELLDFKDGGETDYEAAPRRPSPAASRQPVQQGIGGIDDDIPF